MAIFLILVLAVILLRPTTHLVLWLLHLAVGAAVVLWHFFNWVFWVIFGLWAVGRVLGTLGRRVHRADTGPDAYRWRPDGGAFDRARTRWHGVG